MYWASDCSLAAAAESSPRRSRAWSRSCRACAQSFVDFRQPRAYLFGFELQQAVAGFAGIAFGFEIDQLAGNLLVLALALQLLRGRGIQSATRSEATRRCISRTSNSIRSSTAAAERCRSSSVAARARCRVAFCAAWSRRSSRDYRAVPGPDCCLRSSSALFFLGSAAFRCRAPRSILPARHVPRPSR